MQVNHAPSAVSIRHPAMALGLDMDSEAYRNEIERVIREMKGEPVLNGSHAHASIIIERMFANARDCVQILTRKFDPRIYGTSETVEEARLYLGQPDRKCRIIVEEYDQTSFENHPFILRMSPFFEAGNVEVRRLTEHYASIVNVNFSLMDDCGFRFEEDKKEAVAVAAFGTGTEKFVKSLRSLFDSLWDKAIPVDCSELSAIA